MSKDGATGMGLCRSRPRLGGGGCKVVDWAVRTRQIRRQRRSRIGNDVGCRRLGLRSATEAEELDAGRIELWARNRNGVVLGWIGFGSRSRTHGLAMNNSGGERLQRRVEHGLNYADLIRLVVVICCR